VGDVEVAADGERRDELAPGLLDRGELDTGPGGDVESDLLPELALGGDPGVLAIDVLALRNRPRALVLACPERSAGVADQHFYDTAVGDPVQQ
jgi:hypothetical protein